MPTWNDSPPPTPSDFSYRLIRVPPTKLLHCVILCPKPTGTPTHFFKGHTMPCEGKECPACQEGLLWRWHAYLPCLCTPGHEKVILELTAQACDQLTAARNEYRTLRGLEILAERPSHRPNGRIRITVAPGLRPDALLPPCPDVPAIMLHIWGLDDTKLTSRPGKLGSNRITPAGQNGDDLIQNIGTMS